MRKLLLGTPAALAVVVALGLAFRSAPQPLTYPRALVVVDYSDDETHWDTVSAAMTARGWTAQSTRYSGLVAESAELSANYDVIWVLPGADEGMLYDISNGILADFADNGGMVVITGVDGGEYGALDLAPGGIDAFPESHTGSTALTSPGHPLLNASAAGGSVLAAQDLDPAGTGGNCRLADVAGCMCLAHNAAGSALTVYDLGFGHVVVSVYDMLDAACLGNLLIYTESVVAGL